MNAIFVNQANWPFPKRTKFFSWELQVSDVAKFYEKKWNECEETMKTKKPLKLGPTLQRLLKERNMTMKELAFESGVPLSTLAHFKNNRPPKDIASVQLLADSLGCSLHFLLFGENESKSEPGDIAAELFSGVFEVTVKRIKK